MTTGPVVVFTFDRRAVPSSGWSPTTSGRHGGRFDTHLPPPDALADALGGGAVSAAGPRDCTDGFMRAWWCRPEAYLDPATRPPSPASPASTTTRSPPAWRRLQADLDLARGRRHARLAGRDEIDAGTAW
ncbi:MAG: hypothetical protein H6518_12415 [Microthrixaceae bacterium]|nr:hypothetical protein [Microthrixaceae bacterium]